MVVKISKVIGKVIFLMIWGLVIFFINFSNNSGSEIVAGLPQHPKSLECSPKPRIVRKNIFNTFINFTQYQEKLKFYFNKSTELT